MKRNAQVTEDQNGTLETTTGVQVVASDTTVAKIIKLTRVEYDAIPVPDALTLYLIIG